MFLKKDFVLVRYNVKLQGYKPNSDKTMQTKVKKLLPSYNSAVL